MKIVNKRLSLDEFKKYITGKDFYPNMPNRLVIHHTWKPTEKDWRGQPTIDALKRNYEEKGWNAGPHIFIAPDGIWLFTDMKTQGIHANEGNYRSIGIEVVGDYDGAKWSGKIKEQAVGVIVALMEELDITEEFILFHRDFNKSKSCPGKEITKKWVLEKIKEIKTTQKIDLQGFEIQKDDTITTSLPKPATSDCSASSEIWQDAITEILVLIKKFFNLLK